MPAIRRYVVIETVINTVVSMTMSVIMAFLTFRQSTAVPLLGQQGLIVDMIPQTFMVTFMTIFMSTMLTRRRRRSGRLDVYQTSLHHRWPRHSAIRALVGGIFAVIILTPLIYLALPFLTPSFWSFEAMLAFRAAYAAGLTVLIAPRVLQLALRESI